MTFTITASGGAAVPVPSGKYVATLEGVEVREGGFDGGQFRIWKFLADVAGTLLPVEGISSMNNGTRTKSFEWLTAILGTEPKVGETVDPIGHKCIVTVGQKDGYPRVEAVAPFTAPEEVMPGVPR